MKEQAIDNKELILALEELEKEKGIKKEYLLESIETALVTAYKRNFDSADNVKITMDRGTIISERRYTSDENKRVYRWGGRYEKKIPYFTCMVSDE